MLNGHSMLRRYREKDSERTLDTISTPVRQGLKAETRSLNKKKLEGRIFNTLRHLKAKNYQKAEFIKFSKNDLNISKLYLYFCKDVRSSTISVVELQ